MAATPGRSSIRRAVPHIERPGLSVWRVLRDVHRGLRHHRKPRRPDAELHLGELADVVAVDLDGEGAVVERLDADALELGERLDLAVAHDLRGAAGEQAGNQRWQLERGRALQYRHRERARVEPGWLD